jgi:hypothetical protein
MDLIKFISDFILATFTTVLVLASHALETHCALREQKRSVHAL